MMLLYQDLKEFLRRLHTQATAQIHWSRASRGSRSRLPATLPRMSRSSILASAFRFLGYPVLSRATSATSHVQTQGLQSAAGRCPVLLCFSRPDVRQDVIRRCGMPPFLAGKSAPTRLVNMDAPGSARWLSNSEWRRKKDRYTLQAKEDGLRSRAAYKLKQMNEKSRILSPGMTVVELGAAPGGWTVVATGLVKASRDVPWLPPAKTTPGRSGDAEKMDGDTNSVQQNGPAAEGRRKGKQGRVICCDLLDMAKVKGATFVQGDFRQAVVQRKVLGLTARGEVDVVLSDMAPNTCGDAAIDHFRIMDLARQALGFSLDVLRSGGTLLVKIFNGSELHAYLAEVKEHFKDVKILKPDSSRTCPPPRIQLTFIQSPQHNVVEFVGQGELCCCRH